MHPHHNCTCGEVDASHDECPEQVFGQVGRLVRLGQLLCDHVLEEHEAQEHHHHQVHLVVRARLQKDREHADDRHDQHRHDQVITTIRKRDETYYVQTVTQIAI